MSNPDDDGNILHETEVEASVREDLEGTGQVGFTNAAIATPASPGVGYVQAEVVALRTAIASILTALRNNGIIAP